MTGSCRASEDVAHSLGVCVFPVEQVHRHLEQHEVRYLQFAFRWMNNLLMRELPLRCTIRLWDTYQSEPEGFSHFHLYVCAAFLVRWRKEILEERDFQVSECLFKDPRWGFLLSSQGYLWESRAAAWKLVRPGQVQPWPRGAVPPGCVLLPGESSRGPVFSADAGGAADRQLGADAVGRVPRLPWSQKLLSSPSSGQPHAAHA